jgi:general secretion pathway protein G
MKPPTTHRGFTVIEVVVVITILLLLAGVLVPIVGSEVARSRHDRAQTDMKAVADAFSRYALHTGMWPANGPFDPAKSGSEDLAGFECLYVNSAKLAGWSGPYLNTGVKMGKQWSIASMEGDDGGGICDPWGRFYKIYYFGRNGEMGPGGGIVLVCAGENGQVDTKAAQLGDGQAAGDDAVLVVTRRL